MRKPRYASDMTDEEKAEATRRLREALLARRAYSRGDMRAVEESLARYAFDKSE